MHLLAATPTPTPTPAIDPDLVTPGPFGFIVIALLAIAVVLLVWDMQRRIRRARYREEVGAELDALQSADDGPGTAESSTEATPDDRGDSPRT